VNLEDPAAGRHARPRELDMMHSTVGQLVAGCCALAMAGCSSGENDELLSVVVISRHGIRSPTVSTATLNQYTSRAQGFPTWPVPEDGKGLLTDVGQQNAARLGAWYRDHYAAVGLLPTRGTCPAAGKVYAYADVDQRTIQTAQGYLDGLFQGEAAHDCGLEVKSTSGPVDPYIITFATGKCAIDTAGDLEAFQARTGGAATLIDTYSTELQLLQTITQSPTPLVNLPTTVASAGYVRFDKGTLFEVADDITEIFQLEYAQGMPGAGCATAPGAACVGWEAIPTGGLDELMKLHVMNIQLYSGLPSFAQVGSTNLMTQLVGTMDQALSGTKDPDVLAPAESVFTMFVAHDVNLAAISAFLGGLSWRADGFVENDPGPAGALVFELHRDRAIQQLGVRLYYVIASLDQMRDQTTLTLETPPQRIPLSIPACGGRDVCPYDQFKSFVASHVRQDCIVTPAPAQ
jgi:4-phytase/acid phosphatase